MWNQVTRYSPLCPGGSCKIQDLENLKFAFLRGDHIIFSAFSCYLGNSHIQLYVPEFLFLLYVYTHITVEVSRPSLLQSLPTHSYNTPDSNNYYVL